ncbi:MAG: endonuclease [Clostridia bacterium]|nr:endonuclease [Clostridia bacterium]
MKNIKKSIIALILLATFILSTLIPVSAAGEPASYSKTANSGERGVVCTTLDGTSADEYYTDSYTYDRLVGLSASALLTQLRGLMTSTHTYQSSYDDCHYKANQTDCENGDGKVLLIYTSYSATMSQWNGWNREHVWPKSLGGNNTKGGGADMHHIRPSDAGVNSSRGNKKYGNVPSGTEKYGTNPAVGYLGGTYNSTYFEPVDEVKGDVARICLYVYVRWGADWGATSVTKVFESVDVLLEWCALDPVDTWEMGRNEVIGNIQGNRNVFIDYPELAWLIFDKEIPADMITPSGEAGEGSSSGGSTTTCTHSWSDTVIKTLATETTAGKGERSCRNCGITENVVIPALGKSEPYWHTDEEMILVMISKNTFDCLFLDYLSKIYE